MIHASVEELSQATLRPLDLLPHQDLREKLVDLALNGPPPTVPVQVRRQLADLRAQLLETDVSELKVVVFGGGTGLSNIIGGDSRLSSWPQQPFGGLKRIFPQTKSVVCITDNGGSTGELLKDLPLMAIGDIRHVLLSSIQSSRLINRYSLGMDGALSVVQHLSSIINYRSTTELDEALCETSEIGSLLQALPEPLGRYLNTLISHLFADSRLANTLRRPHCLGNLLIAAAIYRQLSPDLDNDRLAAHQESLHGAILQGLSEMAVVLGAGKRAVLPCTSTPAQLRIVYTNGVEIPGEHKLSTARRGFPVERAHVDYCGQVRVYDEVLTDIAEADVIVLAPGSLYSSIIPVFKVPGLAEAVRNNTRALKVLVSNLWVQTGETDLSIIDPQRKFHVSDMIRAYERNIRGGTHGLFHEVICISLQDIPASVLQRYGVEGKVPIYLDREEIVNLRYTPVECGVYSRHALAERGVIQHDPDTLATAIRALWVARACYEPPQLPTAGKKQTQQPAGDWQSSVRAIMPFQRYRSMVTRIENLDLAVIGDDQGYGKSDLLRKKIVDILWDHPLIPLSHLEYFKAIHCIAPELWHRDQQWDNVFSFYDPTDRTVKIRADQINRGNNFEVALMIAIGESLLGDYAQSKEMKKVIVDGLELGSVYHLTLRDPSERTCFLSPTHVHLFLTLARMCAGGSPSHYTRLVNKNEGFTPPGLLMGLMYAWYIDNRFATHIEYKMTVLKIDRTDLIPEQLRMAQRRKDMINFFKKVVFGGKQ